MLFRSIGVAMGVTGTEVAKDAAAMVLTDDNLSLIHIYVEEGKVVHSEVVDTNGSGHGALAGVLKALNADVLICGGIGGGAQTALAAAGIKLFGGVSGDADERCV